MRPVKLRIRGKYWDSQIYRGILYLFARDGSIKAVDWDALVDSLNLPPRLHLAAECAFRRSDYLYGSAWDLFFADPDIKTLVQKKFEDLASREIEISENRLHPWIVGEQNNPFPFPHADSVIYNLNMYVAGDSGLWRGTCNKRTRYPVSSRPEKKWDCPIFSVAASYNSLALSAGIEGLWELALTEAWIFSLNPDRRGPSKLTPHSCDACEWMYYSIYGSSYDEGGFLAEFEREETTGIRYRPDGIERTFERVITDRDIFNEQGYSWGTRDKIYQARGREITVARYRPYDEANRIERLTTIPIAAWKGDLVSGGVASFGAIIEYDNAIVVLPSDGEPVTLPGEPVNWRVFPSSRFYQNHLHIIYEDEITIYSFNQDYFVKQDVKIFGSRAITNPIAVRRERIEAI